MPAAASNCGEMGGATTCRVGTAYRLADRFAIGRSLREVVGGAHPTSIFVSLEAYFTRLLSLKIGRMIDIAMKPTMEPISTIISGSIIAVTPLMTAFSSRE